MGKPFLKLFGDAAKIGIGAATGNPLLAVSGVTGVAQTVAKNQTSIDSATRGEASAISTGVLVESQAFSASTPVAISHSVGFTPRGVLPVLVESTSGFPQFRIVAKSSTSVTVEADTDGTASFWIF